MGELADEFGLAALGVALVGGAHVGELDLVVAVGLGLRVEADRQQHWDVVVARPTSSA